MKKIAIIDLGTNTFHLLIAEVNKVNFSIKDRYRVPVKIGEGGINDKVITEEAIQRALSAINEFKETIKENGIAEVKAIATSAIRNAENKNELIQKIKEEADIDVIVISGEEEAGLIYRGIRLGLKMNEDPVLMMDIGGGSVEFIIGNASGILWKKSYEIGAQRLKDMFHKSDPISDDELANLQEYLEIQLKDLRKQIEKYKPTALVGSSGTFETLSDIYCFKSGLNDKPSNGEVPFDIKAFPQIFEELLSKDYEDRLMIPGMIPLRARMIVVAVTIIDTILNWYDFDSIRVSTFSLKEGILDKLQSRE